MPLIVKNSSAIYQEIKQRISAEFGNDFANQSYVNVEITAIAFFIENIYKSLKWIVDNQFLSTAFDEDSIIALCYERAGGMVRKGAVGSSGIIGISGNINTIIPSGTIFNSADGFVFKTFGDATVQGQSVNITNILRVGNIVTVTTATPLQIATNNLVTISGITPTDFNVVNKKVSVISANQFTYEAIGTQGVGAGVGIVTYNIASVIVTAESTGIGTNLPQGAELSIQTPIIGLDSIGYVNYLGLTGGAEIENITTLQRRGLNKIQEPQTLYSAGYYAQEALNIAGIDRAWCLPPQNDDMLGQINIYILPYNVNTEANLRASILNNKYPPCIQESDIIIQAPTQIQRTVTVTGLAPNTAAMQTAVQNSIQSYFETLDMGQDGNIEDIKATVTFTQDNSGNFATFTNVTTASLITAFNELLVYQATVFN